MHPPHALAHFNCFRKGFFRADPFDGVSLRVERAENGGALVIYWRSHRKDLASHSPTRRRDTSRLLPSRPLP